jgi:hypothetical protein
MAALLPQQTQTYQRPPMQPAGSVPFHPIGPGTGFPTPPPEFTNIWNGTRNFGVSHQGSPMQMMGHQSPPMMQPRPQMPMQMGQMPVNRGVFGGMPQWR